MWRIPATAIGAASQKLWATRSPSPSDTLRVGHAAERERGEVALAHLPALELPARRLRDRVPGDELDPGDRDPRLGAHVGPDRLRELRPLVLALEVRLADQVEH